MATYTLSGSGIQLLTAGTTALHVSITTLSPFGGIGNANPPNHYHQALLRPGDGTGFWAPVPVEGGPEWFGLPNGTDRIGYACEGGAVIDVVEVIGGTSPFAGPPGSPGATGATGATGPAGPAGAGFYSAYLCYEDQKASGTSGGTFTSGAWQTRDLNTEVADSGNHGSVAANQITLDAGTYDCLISAPSLGVNENQIRLQNITAGTTLLTGSSEYCPLFSGFAITSGRSVLAGTFVLAGSSVLEVQHRCASTHAGNGFGTACSFGTEVYTTAQFWKR